jgi:ABC-type oligopeptide transport system substrate-binding subunit
LLSKTDAEKIISTNCFEGLLRFDEHGKINLAGATAYKIEKDGLSYIFKLNPKAEWYIPAGEAISLKLASGYYK